MYTGPFRLLAVTPPRTWPSPTARVLPGLIPVTHSLHDYYGDGGLGVDAAIATTPPTPFGCRLRLFDEHDGRFVYEVWSDPVAGLWQIPRIRRDKRYTLIAYDHTGRYNGWIRTGVVPDPM